MILVPQTLTQTLYGESGLPVPQKEQADWTAFALVLLANEDLPPEAGEVIAFEMPAKGEPDADSESGLTADADNPVPANDRAHPENDGPNDASSDAIRSPETFDLASGVRDISNGSVQILVETEQASRQQTQTAQEGSQRPIRAQSEPVLSQDRDGLTPSAHQSMLATIAQKPGPVGSPLFTTSKASLQKAQTADPASDLAKPSADAQKLLQKPLDRNADPHSQVVAQPAQRPSQQADQVGFRLAHHSPEEKSAEAVVGPRIKQPLHQTPFSGATQNGLLSAIEMQREPGPVQKPGNPSNGILPEGNTLPNGTSPATESTKHSTADKMEYQLLAPRKTNLMFAQSDPRNPLESHVETERAVPDSGRPSPSPLSAPTALAHVALQHSNKGTTPARDATSPTISPEFVQINALGKDENLRQIDLVSAEGFSTTAPRMTEGVIGSNRPPELPAQVLRQLVDVVSRHPDKPVEILLNPEELGRVRLVLSGTESQVSLHIHSERPETADFIRRHLDQLAEDFRALGYDNLSFAFGQDHEGQRHQEDTQTSQHSMALRDEAALTQVVQFVAPQGLDIRI